MKIFKAVVVLIIFFGGILIGFFFKNFPYIGWNKEVKIYEAFQVFSTLFIGIAIPFLIKKWIDDGRTIKILLGDEAKEVINESKKIKEKLAQFYEAKNISEDDKQYLLLLISQLEDSINHFENSIKNSFGMKCNSKFQDLKIAYYEYCHKITGGDFMTNNFTKITLDFIQMHTIAFNNFQNAIRIFIITLQKI